MLTFHPDTQRWAPTSGAPATIHETIAKDRTIAIEEDGRAVGTLQCYSIGMQLCLVARIGRSVIVYLDDGTALSTTLEPEPEPIIEPETELEPVIKPEPELEPVAADPSQWYDNWLRGIREN